MLAQNFMTPVELGLSDAQHAALVKVLGMLERGDLRHVRDLNLRVYPGAPDLVFNMGFWIEASDCGTACCIGGSAEYLSGLPRGELDSLSLQDGMHALSELFYAYSLMDHGRHLGSITHAEAAIALRNYLTRGEADWPSAIKAA